MEMEQSLTTWVGFLIFTAILLAVDLVVFNRRAHAVSLKEATIWSLVWVALALAFAAVLLDIQGKEKATEFITGYVIEKSLSVDNLFVFVLIFAYFKVPFEFKQRVLFWGIIGALVLRGILIVAGAALLEQFSWITYVFGAFLIVTGLRVAFVNEEETIEPEKNRILKLFRRFYPVTEEYHGTKLFVKREGKRYATPMLMVVIMVATTDVLFALDSIPAIFAITLDPFIVFTANVFAVLGLRALYFLLAGIIDKFYYLKYGLALVLVFVGVKLALSDIYHIDTSISLAIIGSVLATAGFASFVHDKRLQRRNKS